MRREMPDLRVGGELEEVSRAAAALFLIRQVAADHVAAGPPDRPAELEVQRLGALRRADPHDVALLDPRPAAEGEVDEHRGAALEGLPAGAVGPLASLATLSRWRPARGVR